jgi:predicted ArsR family transcriptional regulator
MISCTEFIPAYSQLFKTLERLGGQAAVEAYWRHLSAKFLTNLHDLVVAQGLRGCWLYWSHTLSEEAADFTMELDEEAGTFSILMHHCPSKGRLLEWKHIEPYHDYCRHCDTLYREVLEPLGFSYEVDLSQCDQARCRLVVKRRSRP